MLRFTMSILFIIFITAGELAIEGINPAACLAVTSFTLVLIITLTATAGVWKLSEISEAFHDAFTENRSSAGRSFRIFNFMEKMFYASGIICTLLGIITVLSQINDMEKIGKGAAFGITGILYGVFLGIIARMLKERTIHE